MDPLQSAGQATSQKNSKYSQQNSFAKALAELEKNSSRRQAGSGFDNALNKTHQGTDVFNADELKKGGQQPSGQPLDQYQPPDRNLFQEMMKAEAEKKRRHLEQHRKINPVDLHEVYDGREEKTKKDINELRQQLKKLAEEMNLLNKEITMAVTQHATDTGMTGTYHENFFEQLRQVIVMLRQRVSSARTWARQQRLKQARKKKRGLDFGGNEAKAVHDSFHHERSMAFGA